MEEDLLCDSYIGADITGVRISGDEEPSQNGHRVKYCVKY